MKNAVKFIGQSGNRSFHPSLACTLVLFFAGLFLTGCSESASSSENSSAGVATISTETGDSTAVTQAASNASVVSNSTTDLTASKIDAALAQTTTRPDPGAGVPILTFTTLGHDFGAVTDTTEVKTTFPFTNTGTGVLIIEQVKASCGCTTPALAKKEFQPGEGSEIEVAFRPKGASRITKTITVTSNSTDSPTTLLTVSADVTPFLKMMPNYIRMSDSPLGKANTKWVTITTVDENVTLEELRSSNEFVTAKIVDPSAMPNPPAPDPGRPGLKIIEVTLTEDAPWGPFNASIFVTGRGYLNNQETTHQAVLRLNGSVVHDIRPIPNAMRMRLDPASDFTAEIHIRRENGEPFNVLSATVIDCNLPDITASFESFQDARGAGWRLIVSGNTRDFVGRVNGKLEFTTDVPGDERRQIDISGSTQRLTKNDRRKQQTKQ